MAPSKRSKSIAPAKQSKSKLSTLTLDSLTSGPKSKTPPVSSSASGIAAANKSIKPLTSFSKPPTTQPNGKGNDMSSTLYQPKGKNVAKDNDDQLWVDKYVPQTEDELAVHKKKVEDVRRWLTDAFDGGPTGVLSKYRRILALTGHAGTGKTTTLRVLAREMGFEILEWRNPSDDNFSGDGDDYDRESLTNKFQAFLTRASSCGTLPLMSSSSSSTASSPSRKIILIEDLPNILHPRTADAFHTALQNYIISPSGAPLVFIISDAGTRGEDPEDDLVGSSGGRRWRRQALDVRSVVPSAIFNSPYFTEVQFNPIAPTLLVKALNSHLTKHFSLSRKTKSAAQPAKEIVQMIVDSAHGDIRSAVMALQFAYVVQLPKGKKKGDARSVLEAVTRREQSLALFHMLGKVLYNKRKEDPSNTSTSAKDQEREQELDAKIHDPPALPAHLTEHARRGSRVDVNTLYADSPIDTSLFALYLHHNYTQFCDEVEECDGVCEWLSWIDAFGGESWQTQQNPHQFHLLTLGALHSLPSPVPRRSQKMFKPEFFDVLKKARGAEEAIADTEEWLSGAIEQDTDGARKWARDEVVLELGGVLRALDTCGFGDPPPPTHRTFTALTFVHPSRMPSSSQRMQRLEEGDCPTEDVAIDEVSGWTHSWRGLAQAKQEQSGGWLDSDDIQEF